MTTLEQLAVDHCGSVAILARRAGIDEQLLRDFSSGQVQPDEAHKRRIRQVLSVDLDADLFPHRPAEVYIINVTEAQVVAKRDESLVRPQDVKADDMIRLVEGEGPRAKVRGWVKAAQDAEWLSADTVAINLKGGGQVRCHPAQTVTVARRPAQ